MVNLRYLRRMAAGARALHLSGADTCRFLWSYYGSRFPGAEARRSEVHEIVVRNQVRPVRLALRTNGFDVDIADEIFARGAYRFRIPGVRTILDLGGNTGMASVFFRLVFPDAALACVEPVPANLRTLRRNLELNGLEVRVFEAAVGPEDGTTQFQVISDPRSGSAIYSEPAAVPDATYLTVPMISVDSILQALGWDRIDLLKIDIEGGERQLLANRPPWLARVGAMVGEGHIGWGGKYTFEDLAAQLHPFGFRVSLLEQRQGGFVFAADSDGTRDLKLAPCLSTKLDPLREVKAGLE
jgi:FkbM family methyltransferase